MSRLKNFTRSLFSGYLLLGVNVAYTLASVPVALKFLSKPEFGLWALTLQITNYIALIDLGMSSSVARILIDHKDERANGRYGGAIKSGFLVGAVQALITLVVGLSMVWFMAGWLRVPDDLSRPFLWLMVGQILLAAGSFATRMFMQILYAWQRLDVYNYGQMLQFIVSFAVLWLGFVLGWGVMSLLAGAVAGWLAATVYNVAACWRLGLWPRAEEWGPASRQQFRELFSYGADIFLITISVQFIISSQTILVSRQLGVEAAALWSVMTKAFTLVNQVIWRGVGSAMPGFGEMFVRKEMERLWHRYRMLFIGVSVVSGVAAVFFAACNGPFVTVWTHGRFSWPSLNNVLLGVWLIFSSQQCCHNSFLMCLKQVREIKYAFLLEGALFVGVALLILPRVGITGMVVCSLVATIAFTWLLGAWRVAQLMGGQAKPLFWDWQRQTLAVVAIMVPFWLAADWLLANASPWWRLSVNGCLLTVAAGIAVLGFGLPEDMASEAVKKLPASIQPLGTRYLALRFGTASACPEGTSNKSPTF